MMFFSFRSFLAFGFILWLFGAHTMKKWFLLQNSFGRNGSFINRYVFATDNHASYDRFHFKRNEMLFTVFEDI